MTDIDLDALEATARAATPGPWGRATSATRDWALVLSASGTAVEYRVSQSVDDDDAEHIATFDPPTVLALIARLREAEAAIDKVDALAAHFAGRAMEAEAVIAEVLANPNGFEWDVPPTAKHLLATYDRHN